MKKIIYNTALTCLVLVLVTVTSLSGQGGVAEMETDRRGQTGLKFLTVAVDARGASMAGAMTSQDLGAAAMFYNPASMASFDRTAGVAVGQTQWIADVGYNAGSAILRTGIGVFGVSLISVDYGDFEQTIRADNDKGYIDMDPYSPTAMALGIGYGRTITNRFTVGGIAKYVAQDLGEAVTAATLDSDNETIVSSETGDYAVSTIAFDFGVIYRTGFRSLQLALQARNFSRELTYVDEHFELPLSFRIGLSMNLVDLMDIDQNVHSLLVNIDSERPRDYFEQIKIGAEYKFLNTLSLRGGYLFPSDEQGINVGVGVQKFGVAIDYSYTDFGVFEAVNRFSLRAEF